MPAPPEGWQPERFGNSRVALLNTKAERAKVEAEIAAGSYDGMVAFIEGSACERDLPNIRSHLAERLPDYMCPQEIAFLERFPENTSGKIDRNALAGMLPLD